MQLHLGDLGAHFPLRCAMLLSLKNQAEEYNSFWSETGRNRLNSQKSKGECQDRAFLTSKLGLNDLERLKQVARSKAPDLFSKLRGLSQNQCDLREMLNITEESQLIVENRHEFPCHILRLGEAGLGQAA